MDTKNVELEGHGELLDRIYSFQRHIYDVTRKYFLFGRDRVIEKIQQDPPGSILELGCGTGRNLFMLEKQLPGAALFGIDASKEMLKHAESHAPKESLVQFGFGYAESFSPKELFQVEKFSAIFFSYSLSMMPNWQGALEHALTMLEPNGTIWIVDFWDQAEYPSWFQKALQKWLAMFHVKFEPALLEFIIQLEGTEHLDGKKISVTYEPVGKRYGYLARIQVKEQNTACQ